MPRYPKLTKTSPRSSPRDPENRSGHKTSTPANSPPICFSGLRQAQPSSSLSSCWNEGATHILHLTLFFIIIHKNLPRLTVQLKEPAKGINGHPTSEGPRNP